MTILSRLFSIDADRIAVSVAGEAISYRRFRDDIEAMALWLGQNHVGPATKIGITPVRGSYWSYVAHIGALRVGAHHITINGSKALARAVELGLYVHLAPEPQGDLPKAVRKLGFRPEGLAPLADQLGLTPSPDSADAAEQEAARIALTSGTTGKPRALRWDHALIEHRIDQTIRGAGISPDTRALVTLNISTTGGFRYPLAIWSTGGCLYLRGQPGETADPSWKFARNETNLLVTSPPNLRSLMDMFRDVWPNRDRRTIIVLGGRVPVGLRDRALRQVGNNVIINYGSTETGSVTAGDSAILDRHPGAVGFARDAADIEIVDADGKAVAAGDIGTVRIRTEGMCSGYEGEPEGDGAFSSFRDGWFYPGDEGIRFEDGLLAIAGRNSETVNIGGVKVSVPDVEAKLAEDPRVKDVCVVPVSVVDMDMLAFVMELPPEVDPNEFYPLIKPLISAGISFRVVRVRSIPRNAMGKIQRQELSDAMARIFARHDRPAKRAGSAR
jgi:acyl-coenzyme A synthetase/AMP-(fatty) acid ligase